MTDIAMSSLKIHIYMFTENEEIMTTPLQTPKTSWPIRKSSSKYFYLNFSFNLSQYLFIYDKL